ncbi:hypothetical protein L3V82_08750 [Thiotrichales bacterium 19S3-7]|nr:hypothetical protein [Thiotrichales bacterium 19S3-7]MCF6802192.1 hypothetical protein [Thiotrichales bacterium 19S3-11]
MKKIIRFIIGCLLVTYPFIVYFGLSLFTLRYVIIILGLIFVLRLFLVNWVREKTQARLSRFMIVIIAAIGLALCLFALIFNNQYWVQLYPFFINLLLFLVFLYSFLYPPTMIERFASISSKSEFPDEAILYMRKVTLVWMVFFIINGLIALLTALVTSIKVWALYNGFIAYVLIALIFVIEYGIRQRLKKKLDK